MHHHPREGRQRLPDGSSRVMPLRPDEMLLQLSCRLKVDVSPFTQISCRNSGNVSESVMLGAVGFWEDDVTYEFLGHVRNIRCLLLLLFIV